jgi:gluconate 2-dehydrogenase gamma chain
MDRREALRRAALLFGGAISAPTLAAMMAACETSHPPEAGWTPRVLKGDLGELVATVAELIIPETDTPGARSVGVHRFIDTMLAESFPTAERERFVRGLGAYDAVAKELSGKRFLDARVTDQSAVLNALDHSAYEAQFSGRAAQENEAARRTENATGQPPVHDSMHLEPKIASRTPDRPQHFRVMKELVLLGYYTSQAGMTRELQHQAVPGKFQGCVPLATVGRAWAV